MSTNSRADDGASRSAVRRGRVFRKQSVRERADDRCTGHHRVLKGVCVCVCVCVCVRARATQDMESGNEI